MATISAEERWREYYKYVANRHPRELLMQAIRRFGDKGHFDGQAVDYGCGPGIETRALLEHGWHVLATDYQSESISLVQEQTPEEHRSNLITQVASFENVDLPPSDLIWAGNSLPFCPPEHLDGVLAKIVSALKPGGRFAGDFFGPRHGWAGESHVTAADEAAIKNAFSELKLEYWIEHEGERQTTREIAHWHGYSVIFTMPLE